MNFSLLCVCVFFFFSFLLFICICASTRYVILRIVIGMHLKRVCSLLLAVACYCTAIKGLFNVVEENQFKEAHTHIQRMLAFTKVKMVR